MRGQKAEYGDTADHKAGRLAGHQTAGYNTSYWWQLSAFGWFISGILQNYNTEEILFITVILDVVIIRQE